MLRLATLVVAFISGVIVSRALGPEGRGLYQAALATAALAASLGSISTDLSTAQRFAASTEEAGDERGLILGTFFSLGAGLAALASSVAVIVYVCWLAKPGTVDWVVLVIIWGVTAMTLIRAVVQRTLLIRGAPVMAAGLAAVDGATCLAATAAMGAFGKLSMTAAVACVGLGMSVSVVGGIALAGLRPRISRALALALLQIGLRYHPGQVALALLVRLDVLLVAHLADLRQVGLYAVAVSICIPIEVLGSTMAGVQLTRQLTSKDDDAARTTKSLMRSIGLSVIGISVIVLLASPFVVPTIWGADFAESVPVLFALAPGVVALSVQRPVGQWFVRSGLSGPMNVRALSAVVLNVILCFALIPTHGAMGAAVSSSIAYVWYASFSLLLFVSKSRGVSRVSRGCEAEAA